MDQIELNFEYDNVQANEFPAELAKKKITNLLDIYGFIIRADVFSKLNTRRLRRLDRCVPFAGVLQGRHHVLNQVKVTLKHRSVP